MNFRIRNLTPEYCRLTAGQMFVATSGDYSCMQIVGVFRALVDLDLAAEAAAFAERPWEDEVHDTSGSGLWADLIRRNLIAEELHRTFNVECDYGDGLTIKEELSVREEPLPL